MTDNRITLDTGITIDLLQEGDRFLGLGAVSVAGVPLRSDRLPILPLVRTPDAVEAVAWRITSRLAVDGGVDLTLAPTLRRGGVMDWMLHRVHNRWNLADWSEAPAEDAGSSLTLSLRPLRRRFRDSEAAGFSYAWRWRSPRHRIFRLLDRASWEPGGRSVGCEFWLRGGTAPPIRRFDSTTDAYSTEWWLPGIHNPSIFQFMPLQTLFCGFTMTCCADGALLTLPDGVAHIRSLFERRRGTDEILHLHEHGDDLTGDLATRPIGVLWVPGARDRIANANLWEAVREDVYDRLHREVGLRQERVDVYGVVEEWGMPDFARYTREAVPALLAAGVKQVYIPNEFENNMNAYGVSNMCCTTDWRIADRGRAGEVAAFCTALRAGGAEVHHWGNTAISTLEVMLARGQADGRQGRVVRASPGADGVAERLAAVPDAWVCNPAGHLEADHYSPVFAQVNLRSAAVRELWLQRWREARERLGFAGIFLDSSFNMSSDKWHWVGQVAGNGGATIDQTSLLGQVRPDAEPPAAILSQYRAYLDLMVAMQRDGYHINTEDIGVFGTHRSGPDMRTRLDNLFMWNECLANYDAAALRQAGADPQAVFHEALAHRCMWMLCWVPRTGELSWRIEGARDDDDRPSAGQFALLRAFSRANADMRCKTIRSDGRLVAWDGGARRILWTLAEAEIEVSAGCPVEDLVVGAPMAVADGRCRLAPCGVYAVG